MTFPIGTCFWWGETARPYHIIIWSHDNELVRHETYRTAELAETAFFSIRETFSIHPDMWTVHLRYRNRTDAMLEKPRTTSKRRQLKERGEQEYIENIAHRRSRWMVET